MSSPPSTIIWRRCYWRSRIIVFFFSCSIVRSTIGKCRRSDATTLHFSIFFQSPLFFFFATIFFHRSFFQDVGFSIAWRSCSVQLSGSRCSVPIMLAALALVVLTSSPLALSPSTVTASSSFVHAAFSLLFSLRFSAALSSFSATHLPFRFFSGRSASPAFSIVNHHHWTFRPFQLAASNQSSWVVAVNHTTGSFQPFTIFFQLFHPALHHHCCCVTTFPGRFHYHVHALARHHFASHQHQAALAHQRARPRRTSALYNLTACQAHHLPSTSYIGIIKRSLLASSAFSAIIFFSTVIRTSLAAPF